jgi:hypothetical protein
MKKFVCASLALLAVTFVILVWFWFRDPVHTQSSVAVLLMMRSELARAENDEFLLIVGTPKEVSNDRIVAVVFDKHVPKPDKNVRGFGFGQVRVSEFQVTDSATGESYVTDAKFPNHSFSSAHIHELFLRPEAKKRNVRILFMNYSNPNDFQGGRIIPNNSHDCRTIELSVDLPGD